MVCIWRFARFIIAVIIFINYNAFAVSVGDCTNADKMLSVMQKSIDFDYLGVYRANSNSNQTIKLHPIVLKAICNEYAFRLDFQIMLETFEKSFMDGDKKTFNNVREQIASFLNARKISSSQQYRFFVKCVCSVEYSIVRMLFSRGCTELHLQIIMETLDRTIPVLLFEGVTYSDTLIHAKIFREMIVLAIAIEKWRLSHGKLPNGVAELSLAHKTQSQIDYSIEGDTWQLFSPVVAKSGNPAPFNVYIPLIEYVKSQPKSVYLWLTPDFNRKRRILYEKGMLNEEWPGWTCKMENGKISILK